MIANFLHRNGFKYDERMSTDSYDNYWHPKLVFIRIFYMSRFPDGIIHLVIGFRGQGEMKSYHFHTIEELILFLKSKLKD